MVQHKTKSPIIVATKRKKTIGHMQTRNNQANQTHYIKKKKKPTETDIQIHCSLEITLGPRCARLHLPVRWPPGMPVTPPLMIQSTHL